MAVVTITLHDATLTRKSPGTESFLLNNPLSANTTVSPAAIDTSVYALSNAPNVPVSKAFIKPLNRPGRPILGPSTAQQIIPPPIRISMAVNDNKNEEEQEEEAKFEEAVEMPEKNTNTEDALDTPKAVPIDDEDMISPKTAVPNGSDNLAAAVLQQKDEIAAKHTSLTPSVGSDTSKSISAKPRPMSQRFMSSSGRDRSNSPGRFPVRVDGSSSRNSSPAAGSGRNSPAKRMSYDASSTTMPPPLSEYSLTSQATDQSSPPAPGRMLRKASTGFGGFFGRINSIGRTALSPPARGSVDRRNSTTGANGVDHASLASLVAGGEASKSSLQDRFQTLRKREEHHEDGDEEERENAIDDAESEEGTISEKSATRTKRASSTQSQLKGPPLNHDLPPGTASGMSAGPARQSAPVNWDLWQTVVYEGPAAVARTSGDELSKAIASGIPAAIRGVVWQVLAQSKSDELEALYKTLKSRGSESEAKVSTLARTDSDIAQADKEDELSSRSSVVSIPSTVPAASSVASPPASVEQSTAEVQQQLLTEKHKREAAAVQKLEKAIRRDLGSRTSYSKYAQSAGLQDGLFGLCKAYALFDTPVGYAQGINFIAMPLLFNMPEEEAFTLLVRMMHHYQLRTLFEPEMPGLHLRLYQFERLLEDQEPALYCHLKRQHVSPQLYATQWFLTLFAYRFPLQLVLRVYDLLFSEGLTAILKFGLVLMQKNRDTLLEMKDMSHLTTFLKEKLFDAYIDKSPSASSILDSGFFGSVSGGADKELYRADELVQDATQINISQEILNAYEVEWEEQRRTDRERELELDNLRTSNTTLQAQVKTLEERVQQHDTEHVGIASDLVKYKVENDSLHDAKEALEMQVQVLQALVDRQPAEIEQKLKAEMDRIMQRNLEVQNENRHLQDELENAEQQLVKISVTHAETQSELDTLKQKWSGLQAMMNGK